MVHFDLLAFPPGIPRGFGIFFFPSGLFPTPGNAVGGNSPAPSSWSTSYRFFSRYIFLGAIVISYNSKTRRFQNFYKRFSRVYWEKDNTWQLKHEQHVWKRNERKKTIERLPDWTLQINTGLNRCLCVYIKSVESVFIYSLFICWLIIKLGWRNISLFLLQTNIHSSTHHTHIRLQF